MVAHRSPIFLLLLIVLLFFPWYPDLHQAEWNESKTSPAFLIKWKNKLLKKIEL